MYLYSHPIHIGHRQPVLVDIPAHTWLGSSAVVHSRPLTRRGSVRPSPGGHRHSPLQPDPCLEPFTWPAPSTPCVRLSVCVGWVSVLGRQTGWDVPPVEVAPPTARPAQSAGGRPPRRRRPRGARLPGRYGDVLHSNEFKCARAGIWSVGGLTGLTHMQEAVQSRRTAENGGRQLRLTLSTRDQIRSRDTWCNDPDE